MKKFKVSYFTVQGSKKSKLPVMQFLSLKSNVNFPEPEKIESAINKTLSNNSRCELDCYSPV